MRARAGTALVGRRHKRAEKVHAFFARFLDFGMCFGREDVVRRSIWASEELERRPKSASDRFLKISAQFWERFCVDFRLEIASEIEVENKWRKNETSFARGRETWTIAPL